MNVRALLAAIAVTAAIAAPAQAAVAATPAAPVAPAQEAAAAAPATTPALHVLNLHAGFERAAARAAAHPAAAPKIAGIVPPRTAHVKKTAAAAQACQEPDCDLQYNGGPVQHSPHVYVLLWGPDWSGSSPAFDYMASFYSGLGVSPQDNWSTVTSQYGDGSGHPSFGSSVLQGTWQDSSTPPDPVTPSDLSAEATGFINAVSVPDLADAQIVIMSQSGTCFSDGFAGSCGTTANGGSYCAWHSYTGSVSYTNLPYQLDAGGECGENWINSGSAGTYDGFSTVGGHEYAEAVTDPEINAWYDPSDSVSGGEIGDKCAWGGSPFGVSDPAGDVQLSTGSFAMQSLWSNANGACVM